jgi:UDP-glucose 4-epimerase
MQILITGGAGFIGGHLAEHFAREGHEVVVLDNFEPFYDIGLKERTVELGRAAARESDGSYELVRGDIRDEELVEQLTAEAEVIFHQAAQAGVRTSVDHSQRVHQINATGTLNVLEAARNSTTDQVVVASSSSVYGVPKSLPYTEDHPKTPISPYGGSKLAAEQYTRMYNDLYGLATVALRYFTVYGPRMRPNMAISNFISRCKTGNPPVIYGSGEQTRDFTYIDDIVDANDALLGTNAADGEIMNIGSTETITIKTLAREIRDQIAPELPLEYDDRHAADADHTHADITKATEFIGYQPSIPITTGLCRFINWYEDNQDWYEPLVLNS